MRPLDRSAVPAPACLSRYRPGTHRWDDLTPADRAEIRQALDAMQGRLCADCEGPLDRLGRHIEHFRSRSRHPALTFAWSNLLGSCDRTQTCGRHKDNEADPDDPDDLIDPSGDDPDSFFRFLEDGTIALRDGLTTAEQRRARETIRVLALDLERNGLPQRRRDAIRTFQAREPDFLADLILFSAHERHALIAQELAVAATQPFSTVVRHFLEGLS